MIHIHDVQSQYDVICERVLQSGDDVSPRGMKTKELLGTTIVVQDTTRSLPVHIGRGCNPDIGAVEAIQLIGGFSDPKLVCDIAPSMKQFLTEDTYFHGAYGPRIKSQLGLTIQALKKDRDTRQAVMTIWDPGKDCGVKQPDLPCTVSLHFLIRRNKLLLHTHMRSNDVWWGLAYDIFQFTQLQLTVATQLGVTCGSYYHHTSSLHIYERDWDKVDQLHAPTEIMTPLWGFNDTDRAWKIGHGLAVPQPSYTEDWYTQRLAPFLG